MRTLLKFSTLLIFILLSVFSYGQSLNLPANQTVTIPAGTYDNITYGDNTKVIIEGLVKVKNLNINGQKTFTTVKPYGDLQVESSINLNGSDTLIVQGRVSAKSVEEQNGNNLVRIVGGSFIVEHEYQINDDSKLYVCGPSSLLTIGTHFNINGASHPGNIVLCDCATIKTEDLNNNADDVVTGNGNIIINGGNGMININKHFTTSNTIYVKTERRANQPENWGAAQVNSSNSCTVDPMPVTIISSDFKLLNGGENPVQYTLEITTDSNLGWFTVERSLDNGKTWEQVLHPIKADGVSTKYTGKVK